MKLNPQAVTFLSDLEQAAARLAALASMLGSLIQESSEQPVAGGVFQIFNHEAEQLEALHYRASLLLLPFTAGEEPAQVESRPRMMRDRFIRESFADGFSPADISMALGLPQRAVKRAIDRLKGDGASPRQQAG